MNKKQAIERAKRDLPKALIRIPSKSDARFSLKSAQPDKEYLDAVKHLGDTDELRNILQTAIKNNTLGKAPNGKQSNLEPAQWLMVRTKQFKDWFGDWEKSYKKQFLLNSDTVCRLTGKEFQKQPNKTLTQLVGEYFNKIGNIANSPIYGKVVLDEKGAEDSFAHGMGRMKAISYAAVKDVIENGIIVDFDENHKNRNYDSVVIAAPIEIKDQEGVSERYICEVVITKKGNSNRYYLHEVTTHKKIQNAVFVTNSAQRPSTHSGDLQDILHKIINVNSNEISKVVDENGEPLVVWTGTDSAFNEFKPKKIGTRTDSGMSGKGFYFGKKNYAKRYEGRKGVTRAFFLNIKNPIIVKGMGTNETVAWNSKNVKEAKERLEFYNSKKITHRQTKTAKMLAAIPFLLAQASCITTMTSSLLVLLLIIFLNTLTVIMTPKKTA